MNATELRGQMMFMTWVQETYPDLYQAVLNRVASQEVATQGVAVNNRQLGQVGPPAPEMESWWSKASTAFMSLGVTYLGLKNQRDVLKINLERAKKGLPPISNENLTAPIVQTRVDVSPEVMDKLTAGVGTQMNKVLLFGGIALLGVLLFMRKK